MIYDLHELNIMFYASYLQHYKVLNCFKQFSETLNSSASLDICSHIYNLRGCVGVHSTYAAGGRGGQVRPYLKTLLLCRGEGGKKRPNTCVSSMYTAPYAEVWIFCSNDLGIMKLRGSF